MKKWLGIVLALFMLIAVATPLIAEEYFPPPGDGKGVIGGRHEEAWRMGIFDQLTFKEIADPAITPSANTGRLYAKDNGALTQPYWEDNAGTVTNLLAGTTWDTIADPAGNASITLGTYTNTFTGSATAAHQNQFINTGNMGDYAVIYIQQLTGTPTDGKLLYGTMASDLVDGIQIYSSDTDIAATGQVLLRLDFKDDDDTDGYFIVCRDNSSTDTEFSVDMVGNIVGTKITLASTVLDVNSLDFVGAGSITTGASTALTLNSAGGDAAGEDLIITAHNISLTANGLMTFSPDGALAIAIDATDTDIATALSVGANDIVGTTGLINYTNFDVDAAGAVVCTALNAGSGTIQTTGDITSGGTLSGVTVLQDAISAKTNDTTLTLNGKGTGGVSIGTVAGTGTITIGGGGFATLVNLPSTVDLTLAGGQLSVTDTANADLVTLVNNTLTTAEILDISATGTRTSGSVIKITDGASTASTISITASTQTSGKGISYVNAGSGILTGDALYLAVTDGAGFSGSYINCYDGTASDFTVKRYGATVIAGNASGTDALTLTNGDILVTAGNIDITTGTFTVGTGSVAIATNGNFSTARGGIKTDTVDDDSSYIKRNQTTTTAALFTIEETHTGADYPALVVTQNATGAIDAVDIAYAGTTNALHITNTNAGAEVIYIDVANATTAKLITIDAGPWVGTAGQGMIDITTDSAATQEAGTAIRVKMQGSGVDAAAIDGKGLYIEDEGAATAGSYLVKLDTLANTALHISNAGAAADGIKFDVANSYTGQGIVADLGTWLGTTNEGFIDISSDNAATVPAGQIIRIRQLGTGQHAAAIGGSLIYLEDDATAPAAGTSYVMKIDATNIEAIHVDTGKVLVDETVTATGGISTGNAADSFLYTDTVELTSQNVKALHATPITLVAAKGANNIIEFVSAVLILDYSTAVFTEVDDNLVIEYEDGQDVTAAIEMTGFIDQAADQVAFIRAATVPTMTAATASNKAIRLYNPNDEIGGNAGNQSALTVKVTYWVHANGL